MTPEEFAQQKRYWDRDKLSEFSSDEMFRGARLDLSLEIARTLWEKIDRVLEATPDNRYTLLEKSSTEDGGEAALNEIFGIGLNDLSQSFLGEM